MTDFQTYLILGLEHIADLNGYDHILFICVLCALFQPSDWKKILIQITAFTLGHSFSLALSVTNIFTIESKYIEVLIPITILITAISNFFHKENIHSWKNYALTVFFGLIHGLGFSYLLKMLLGKESDIFFPLLAFNLGLEIGQILIVGIFLLLTFVVTFLGISHQNWTKIVSTFTIFIASYLLWQRMFA